MADARHRFIPTQQEPSRTARRTAVSRPLFRAAVSWAAVLAVAVLLGRPLIRPGVPGGLRERFAARQAQFRLLRDMLLAEPAVTSVGADNVREYWLFDGRWSSPRHPDRSLSRDQMLEAAALPPARYASYLSLLKDVGAYRAVRSGSGRRVTVHLYPLLKGGGSARVVYDSAPEPGQTASLGEGWFLETDDR